MFLDTLCHESGRSKRKKVRYDKYVNRLKKYYDRPECVLADLRLLVQ